MARMSLAFATLLTLSLNGSIAVAAAPSDCNARQVCEMPLTLVNTPATAPAPQPLPEEPA